ncbi:MAG TPA: rRNA maturation RNase YbeY [Planctomycetota bacterium]|nr:rRNA maturation RNase YbeY [Planctomycetota bacterium]
MIHLTNEQARVRIPAARVRRLATQILGRRNLSIAFVTNAAIRKINRKFLQHDFATDVISFPLGTDLIGELVISADYASAQARSRKIPVEEELLRYVAHGILHLLGYDDHRPADRRAMWKRQERELARVLRGARPPR